ncbi:MAG TPA: hypothetical protein VFK57_11490 [Vicinamibacterales bacterium]|nr:hypothetical protein [Vicinamibacterales bacterium]
MPRLESSSAAESTPATMPAWTMRLANPIDGRKDTEILVGEMTNWRPAPLT